MRRYWHALDPRGRTERVSEVVVAYSSDVICYRAFFFLMLGLKVAADFAWYASVQEHTDIFYK